MFATQHYGKAGVKRRLHKAVMEKTSPGQAVSARKLRCQLLPAWTAGTGWGQHVLETQSRWLAPRASLGPAKLRTGVLLCCFQTHCKESNGETLFQAFPTCALPAQLGIGRRHRAAAQVPMEGGERTCSAQELISHLTWKTK